MYFLVLIPLAILAIILAPVFVSMRTKSSEKKVGNIRKALIFNLSAFVGVFVVGMILPFGGVASAASTTTAAAATTIGEGLGYIAVALSTGLACIGAGIGVSSGAAAAIGAVTEDLKNLAFSMVFVVLGEGIAIYGIAISFTILGHIH
jgi:V/A-type H+-transporting ATPase subunit K